MYARPSASQMRLPSPRTTKRGTPPTARNARTGEFTPPGIVFRERSNSWSFFELMSVEHPREFARALLDIRAVEQGADHRDRIGARVDHEPGILPADPSDRDDRTREAGLGFAVEGQRRSAGAGLDARGKGAAEGDVVRAVAARREREVEPVVARGAEHPARSEARSRRRD